jgi:hypothetical protein
MILRTWVQETTDGVFVVLNQFDKIKDRNSPTMYYPDILTLWTPEQLAAIGVYEPRPARPLEGIAQIYTRYLRVDGEIREVIDYELTNENLRSHSAALRFQFEEQGILFNGIPVATDRSSQSLILGAYVSCTRDPTFTVNWKTTDGFVTLNKDMITAVADAVAQYVEKCFSIEAELFDRIEAGSINQFSQVRTFYTESLSE